MGKLTVANALDHFLISLRVAIVGGRRAGTELAVDLEVEESHEATARPLPRVRAVTLACVGRRSERRRTVSRGKGTDSKVLLITTPGPQYRSDKSRKPRKTGLPLKLLRERPGY